MVKIITSLLAMFMITGCVAPSLTIYGRGTSVNKDGLRKTVAVKEMQAYGDFHGKTKITGSLVSIDAEGGYYNSPIVRETWKGIHDTAVGIGQPLIFMLGGAGLGKSSAGAVQSIIKK